MLQNAQKRQEREKILCSGDAISTYRIATFCGDRVRRLALDKMERLGSSDQVGQVPRE
jgi:hypothetical protein